MLLLFALTALIALTALPAQARAAVLPAPAGDSTAHAVATGPDAHVDSLLTAALNRMVGVIPGSDSLVAWSVFRAHPQRTVDLVLPTLQPIPRSLYLGAPNMVWRVRVLQRLTGLVFTAPTRAKLVAEERAALAPDTLRRVPFAGENAKLGLTWVAPADAQKAIIAAWRSWWASDVVKPELPMKKHDDDRSWWY